MNCKRDKVRSDKGDEAHDGNVDIYIMSGEQASRLNIGEGLHTLELSI